MSRETPLSWRKVKVRGPSMAPTLRDGDLVIAVIGAMPRAGEIGLVRWSARPDQLSVKRLDNELPDGWFVLGDNEFASTDSRELGPADVLGMISWRLWPRPGRVSG